MSVAAAATAIESSPPLRKMPGPALVDRALDGGGEPGVEGVEFFLADPLEWFAGGGRIPVAPGPRVPPLDATSRLPGRNPLDGLVESLLGNWPPVRQMIGKRLAIDRAIDAGT